MFGPSGDPFEGAFLLEGKEGDGINEILDHEIIEARQAVSPSKAVAAAAQAEEGVVSIDESAVTMCSCGVGIREAASDTQTLVPLL